MPILPLGEKSAATTAPTGGSPRGWTFISTAACWRQWMYRYLVGFVPATVKPYFDLGAAYHLFMEGKSVAEVASKYPEQVEAAHELFQTRMRKGPPLGKALAIEVEHPILEGLMTSKPDREEAGLIRDYKTAQGFSDNDEAAWGVNPGIIGEMIAANVESGIVDIVSKRVDADKRVKLVTVKLTTTKREALESMVSDFWEGLEHRVRKAAGGKASDAPKAFGMNLSSCVGKYGRCEYYERCHGKPPESLAFKLKEQAPREWLTGRVGEPLPMPGKLSVDLVEKAAGKVRTALWPKVEKGAVKAVMGTAETASKQASQKK